jgi:hypothetical protein
LAIVFLLIVSIEKKMYVPSKKPSKENKRKELTLSQLVVYNFDLEKSFID